MKTINKPLVANAFAAITFITGLVITIVNQEIFTSFSLLETCLVCASFSYLLFKYLSSLIIHRYQDLEYKSSKAKRLLHDVFVTLSVSVVQPVCLSLLYACSFLLLIKFTAPESLGVLARLTYDVYVFNKESIKDPQLALITILSVLALLNVISTKFLKSVKSYVKLITAPLTTVAVLILFISVDNGISTTYITWNIKHRMR